MDTITKLMSIKEIEELKNKSIYNSISYPPHTIYQIKNSECTITAYKSGKVVFQGKELSFLDNSSPSESLNNNFPQAGSDEVGTGDYFGPICVCACLVKQSQVEMLKDLKISDSKAMVDSYIMQIAPKLIKELEHSLLILDNIKYNEIHEKHNMNAIKAILHNSAYIHLSKRVDSMPNLCVVDQFTPKNNYFKYISNEKNIFKNLHFETKAENKYLAVACASVIARYTFLKCFDSLTKQYGITFLKGAGSKVDEFAQVFYDKYGLEELKKVSKFHFANTDKLIK